jgi:hypothetical protein
MTKRHRPAPAARREAHPGSRAARDSNAAEAGRAADAGAPQAMPPRPEDEARYEQRKEAS